MLLCFLGGRGSSLASGGRRPPLKMSGKDNISISKILVKRILGVQKVSGGALEFSKSLWRRSKILKKSLAALEKIQKFSKSFEIM